MRFQPYVNKDEAAWITTASGRKFYYFDTEKGDPICIEDIAQHLSQQCRYLGATTAFYSVADHSVLCLRIAEKLGLSSKHRLAALLHDAPEAYIGDMPGPLKESGLFLTFWQLESFILDRIERDLDLPVLPMRVPIIEAIDREACRLESRLLLQDSTWTEGYPLLVPSWKNVEDITDFKWGVTPLEFQELYEGLKYAIVL